MPRSPQPLHRILAADPAIAGEAGSRLEMRLHYGGTFGGMVLERLLGDAIERSRPALLDRVS